MKRATVLLLLAMAAYVVAQTAFVEEEIVSLNPAEEEDARGDAQGEDELQVLADGKTCAKHKRTRRCHKAAKKSVMKCPESAGYDYKLLPPCVSDTPCIKHTYKCGHVRAGTDRVCLETQQIRTCPEQCEDGQLCLVSKDCKTLGGVTSCEWHRKCRKTQCHAEECKFTEECVRYTEKDTYIHRCSEGECEQKGVEVRKCKTVPVCKVPEVAQEVEHCEEWGQWHVKCIAWFPARIDILKKEYSDVQHSAQEALHAVKESKEYKDRAAAKINLIHANDVLKASPAYLKYEEKQRFLSGTYSELACRYFGGWEQRKEHCRKWKAFNKCAYAAYACRTSTQEEYQKKQCKINSHCKEVGTLNSALHIVLNSKEAEKPQDAKKHN